VSRDGAQIPASQSVTIPVRKGRLALLRDNDTIMSLPIEPDSVPLAPDESGTIRVAKTRVTLETIVERFRAGDSVEELIEGFPVLTAADIYAVLAYYLRHRGEVDRYLAEQARQADAALAAVGDRHQPWPAVSARLEARKDAGADDASLPR
jgi:uncharacterized protein (DUF433 family)